MIKRVVSRVNLVNKAIGIRRGGDGHHGPRMLPFARLAPPTEQVFFFSFLFSFLLYFLFLSLSYFTFFFFK